MIAQLRYGLQFLQVWVYLSHLQDANARIKYGILFYTKHVTSDAVQLPPALKSFKFLANKLSASETTASASAHPTVTSIQGQLENYLAELQQHPGGEDALTFWRHHHA
jgi:hypothetical protein